MTYVGVLTLVVAAFTTGYVAWTDISIHGFLIDHWLWSVAGGVLAGAIPACAIARMKAIVPAEHGARRAERVAWDGVVYAMHPHGPGRADRHPAQPGALGRSETRPPAKARRAVGRQPRPDHPPGVAVKGSR